MYFERRLTLVDSARREEEGHFQRLDVGKTPRTDSSSFVLVASTCLFSFGLRLKTKSLGDAKTGDGLADLLDPDVREKFEGSLKLGLVVDDLVRE